MLKDLSRGLMTVRILYATVIFIFGLIVDEVFDLGKENVLFSEIILILIFFVVVLVMLILYISIRESQKESQEHKSNLKKIALYLDQTGQVVPHKLAYESLTRWVREAETEILILTNTKSIIWLDREERSKSKGRADWFDIAISRIQEIGQGNRKLHFERILQIDPNLEKDAPAFLKRYLSEEHNKRMTDALLHSYIEAPDNIQLRYITTAFPNSFVLVDRRKLFLNFDFLHPQNDVYESSIVLIATDESGEAFKKLIDIYAIIKNKSRTIEKELLGK